MPGIKLQKRDEDFFVSYGHADLARVATLVDLLKRVCGLRIWFDGADGNAALRSTDLLAGAIRNSRGALFCLSNAWKQSTWCRNEYEVSLSEQRMHDGFEIVCLRLDDVDLPGWFNVAEIVDFRQSGAAQVARLLRSLSSDVPHRFDNDEDVYLAVPWSRPSNLMREDALPVLRDAGWRLVGDAPNLKYLGERRIEAIQRTTRGVVALLPHVPEQPEGATSPFILDEARLALRIGKPLLLLAEPGVNVPGDLLIGASRGSAVTLEPGAKGRAELAEVLSAFDEELQHKPHGDTGAFVFFAGSLRGDPAETDDIVSVVERASNMRCVRGERLAGDNVQTAIIDRIRRAAVMIADVSDDNRNTLIEAGIAMGSGTRLKLICREPPAGAPLKKRFMFEGQEYFWYRSAEERLALCYYFARQFRRRVYVVR
ncbi:toll/interleukin-1 receptor domain-containing protein [Pyxidicoccus parkwayensis]|uniref:Toll/interleukin-1 receptor domain-containing protein n=1 Tax=Pyxidicoccus parkwayensis TaxID=2813578 RepID=A0ABX7P7C3_9BACT|nr:toll/interleukin-1 receptor domain-containing protein [Pyxidicoccus parkwaysis]QSQ26409.1 toll/interleukin-1 receptor domain-containing protein [Pyxidicoccus parkwaysis]